MISSRGIKNMFFKKKEDKEIRRIFEETNDNVNGFSEEEDKVKFFVERKLAESTLNRYIASSTKPEWKEVDFLPETITVGKKEKEVDVVEIGKLEVHSDRAKYRPIMGGCQIGVIGKGTVGTAGLPVKFYTFGGKTLVGPILGTFPRILRRMGFPLKSKDAILTNSHVTNYVVTDPKVERIAQPSGSVASDFIGESIYSAPMYSDENSELDAAIIELDSDVELSDEIIQIGSPRRIGNTWVGEKVHKYGRTTNYTEGECVATNATLTINYGSPEGGLTLEGLQVFTPMSAPGDSGSAILTKDGNDVVSLLFAGSKYSTIGIPITKVFQHMGIALR